MTQDRRHSDSSKYARLRAEQEVAAAKGADGGAKAAVVVRSRKGDGGKCGSGGDIRLSLGGQR